MRNITTGLLLTGAMIAAGTASADTPSDVSPYMGVDYYQAFMKGKSSWDSILPKSYAGASVFIGTRVHESFGIELGYATSIRQKKDWHLANGSSFFAGPVRQVGGISGSTKVRRSGAHMDVIGFLPVAECFELLGSLGFGWVQTKIQTTLNVASSSSTAAALASVAGKGRAVFRVGLGGSYMVTDMVGIRAKLGWESTSSLRVKGNASFLSLGYDSKAFKGTTALSVGAFVKF